MPKLKKTSTGLNLLTLPMTGAKTTAILVMIATGSKHETKNTSGLSHFLEHLFFKGTTKRPNTLIISSELDRLGGEYNAFTNKEYTGFWIKTAFEHIIPAIDVLADMLINSKFDQEEIKRESGVITEEVNMYLDNPMMHIEDVFEELLYGDTPAGRSVIGTKKNIASFTRHHFTKYFKEQYRARSTFVIVAGKLPNKIDKLLMKNFANYPKGQARKKIATKEKQTKPNIKLAYKKTDQAHFSLGVRTKPFGAKEEAILRVLGVILGGSMSSRLFINLRERHGLCYYVKTQNENMTDTGYLTTRAGVTVDKITKAITIVLAEYQRFTQELVSEKELQKIKQFIFGRTKLQLEGPDEVASWYGLQLAITYQQGRVKLITPEQFIAAIKKVTPKQIQKMAQKIFKPNNLNLAIIGPYQDKKKFEKLLK